MNYVEVREIWIGKEPRRLSIVRGIMKDVTLTWLLEGGLRRIYDITKGILFMETREQIRIPAIIFEKLKSDVKEALFKESIYYPTEEGDPRGYWKNCDAYIFDFKGYELLTKIEFSYEGLDDYEVIFRVYPFTHPFIGEFMGSIERRFEETGDLERVKKWLVEE